MKIEYDVTDLPRRKHAGGYRSEETTALQAFMATRQKNMVITCDDVKEAKRTRDRLYAFRHGHSLKDAFDLYCAGNQVVVIKTKKKA